MFFINTLILIFFALFGYVESVHDQQTINFLLACCCATDDSSCKEKGFHGIEINSKNDRALVGDITDQSGDLIPAIVFQGNQQNLNWIVKDMGTATVEVTLDPVSNVKLEYCPIGKVHKGFQKSLSGLYNAGLSKQLKIIEQRSKRILLIGHSKGGAMAVQLAYVLVHLGWQVDLVTFGAPPAMDTEASQFLESKLRIDEFHEIEKDASGNGVLSSNYRIVNVLDVVPLTLVPTFQHVNPVVTLDSFVEGCFPSAVSLMEKYRGILASLSGDSLQSVLNTFNEHHAISRYVDNLENVMIDENDIPYFAQRYERILSSSYEQLGFLSSKLTSTSSEMFANKLKEEITPWAYAQTKERLFDASNNKPLRDGVTILGGQTAADVASKLTSQGAPVALANVNIILACAHMAINMAVLYKVNQLEHHAKYQEKLWERMDGTMRQGFDDVLGAIDGQNMENYYNILQKLILQHLPIQMEVNLSKIIINVTESSELPLMKHLCAQF